MTDGRALSGRARIGVTCLVGVVLFLSSPPPVPRRAMADAAAAAGTDGSDAGVPVTNDGSVTVSVPAIASARSNARTPRHTNGRVGRDASNPRSLVSA